LHTSSLAVRHFFIWLASHLLTGLVLYAVGIVELELESTSALMLLLFIIPLAFTLSGFLLWIMYSLNGVYCSFSKNSPFDKYISHDRAFTGEEATLQAQDVYAAPLHPVVYGARNRHIFRRFIDVILRKTCGRCVPVIQFAVYF